MKPLIPTGTPPGYMQPLPEHPEQPRAPAKKDDSWVGKAKGKARKRR